MAKTRIRRAAFYKTPGVRLRRRLAQQVQGKELSYNNINDTDAAYECIGEFDAKRTPACVIVKHANPCGVAEGATPARSLSARRWPAIRHQPSAASLRSTARSMREAARAITEIFTEVIIAPDATDEAIAIVAREEEPAAAARRRAARSARGGLTVKSVAGGLLVQSRDNAVVDDMHVEGRHQARTDRGRTGGPAFCVPRRQARRSRTPIVYAKDLRDGRHRRGTDEPRRLGAHRRAQGGGCSEGTEARRRR